MSDAGQTWPSSGPDFNRWEDDVFRLIELMKSVNGEPWWTADMPLKYLVIRIDTRDGGFIISDRDGNRISPDRVVAAIARWSKMMAKAES